MPPRLKSPPAQRVMRLKPTKLNISATSDDWRGVALSNFVLSPFVFGGRLFASIEGFIQGIKFAEQDARRERAFTLSAWDAKTLGGEAELECVYWQGERLPYGSAQHHQLIEAAIRARIKQSEGLRQALISTRDYELVHETGAPDSPRTSLPTPVFCRIMNDLRDELLQGTASL